MGFKSDSDGRALWLERRFDLLAETMGFDVVSAPALQPVIAEIHAGTEIKAAQIYTQLFACSLAEAMAAVADLKSRLAPS